MKPSALPRLSALAFALLGHVGIGVAAELSLAQTPPTLGQTLAPNILYIHDDSGSMTWAYMPDGRAISSSNQRRYTSSSWNGVYFNPDVDYPPPIDHLGVSLGNANFTAAWENGYLPRTASNPTRNLATNYRVTRILSGSTVTLATQFNVAPRRAFYHQFNSALAGCGTADAIDTKESCYERVDISGAEQQQNFANWYSYYRTREMTAKAGISRAFSQLGAGVRVGYGHINKNGSSTHDGKSVGVITRGVRDFYDDPNNSSKHYRKQFYDWLLSMNSAGGTPLRRALDAAGRYYENDSPIGPWSTTPGVAGGNILSCRKSFTILMTDGFWNGSNVSGGAGTGNHDGGMDSPFGDDYAATLADVAMYYWKRDLLPNLPDRVPPTPRDPATWQHMTTYTVSLGFDPVNIRANGVLLTDNVKETAFAAISDPSISITWPPPSSDSVNNIADLLHAAVNGRGDFFSAGNPRQFADAMRDTLASISDQVGSIAPLGQSASTAGSGDTLLFQASFDTSDWRGWLTATSFDPENGRLQAVPAWTSSLPHESARNIFSYNTASKEGVPFEWGQLSEQQQAVLDTPPAHFDGNYDGSEVLSWIRGDQSKEAPVGPYRKRSSAGRLGDIVNSKPLYVSARNEGYANRSGLTTTERSAYRTRLASTAFLQRQRMVYVGANDGMLHAFNAGNHTGNDGGRFGNQPKFNAGTGAEVFAYVPAAVMPELPRLVHPEYVHRYFVDGTPVAGDAYIGGAWKTVLVGSTGAGGRSYFALDIENPQAMNADKVMWEFNHNELGFSVGEAAIVRAANNKWVAIFGNGYNSASQRAQLFIVDLATGNLMKQIDTGTGSSANPNGLASPLVVDTDLDGVADLVYAGDFHGNLWKFDLSNSNPANWKIAFAGKPLFKATDSQGIAQPITTRPVVRRHPSRGGLALYFGTGKLLLTGDQGDLSEQALYGIFDLCGRNSTDDCANTGGRPQQVLKSDLQQQQIIEEDNASFGEGADAVNVDYRLVSKHDLSSSQRGFYLRLLPPSNQKQGERVVGVADTSFSDRVIFTTLVPNDDPCEEGAGGWIMEIDPFTGGRKDYSVFDMNNDGFFNTTDFVDSDHGRIPPTGRGSPGGPSLAILHGEDSSFKVGTHGVTANLPDPNLLNRQSWQQHH